LLDGIAGSLSDGDTVKVPRRALGPGSTLSLASPLPAGVTLWRDQTAVYLEAT